MSVVSNPERVVIVLFAVVLGSLCLTGSLDAKCALATYEVSITVVEQGSDLPVPGATLLFFVPGSEKDLALNDGHPGTTKTDSSGTVLGKLEFQTYSGRGLLGDRCKAKLKELEIIVLFPEGPAQRFRFAKLRAKAVEGQANFSVPPLTIEVCCLETVVPLRCRHTQEE